MTGPQLLAKLKESGTGETKLDLVRALVGDKFTVPELLDALRSRGEYLRSTLKKAIGFLQEAGVLPPGTRVDIDAPPKEQTPAERINDLSVELSRARDDCAAIKVAHDKLREEHAALEQKHSTALTEFERTAAKAVAAETKLADATAANAAVTKQRDELAATVADLEKKLAATAKKG